MSYSTLMVQLDLDQSNDKRLQVAAELAARFDSRAIGIVAGDIQPLYFLDGQAAQELLDKERAELSAQMAKCEEQFRHAFRTRADKIEWRSSLEWPSNFVEREARAAGAEQSAAKARIDDVTKWLARRGINTASVTPKALIGVSDQLSIIAHDEGAPLIVAGAYGHSRLQQWIFGGVTRSLLSQRKCSVLLSH